jgi:hypothetical protein
MVQSLSAVGAMILISIGILAMNKGFDANNLIMQNSKIAVMATSLATSKIEEATGKAFDEKTVDSLIATTSGLTIASKLGLDAGESYPKVDDFDDYNNLTVYDTIDGGGAKNKIPFKTTCVVYYVDPNSPTIVQSSPTWNKKIVVTVTSPAMTDTIKQEFIFSYFHFL